MDKREEQTMRFYEAMAESVVHESDNEIFSEAGSAVWAWAREGVRQTLLEGVKAFEQKKLSRLPRVPGGGGEVSGASESFARHGGRPARAFEPGSAALER